jgi:hypothetical protein
MIRLQAGKQDRHAGIVSIMADNRRPAKIQAGHFDLMAGLYGYFCPVWQGGERGQRP